MKLFIFTVDLLGYSHWVFYINCSCSSKKRGLNSSSHRIRAPQMYWNINFIFIHTSDVTYSLCKKNYLFTFKFFSYCTNPNTDNLSSIPSKFHGDWWLIKLFFKPVHVIYNNNNNNPSVSTYLFYLFIDFMFDTRH